MNVLALDAAYEQASACLLSQGILHHETISDPMPHSQAVIPLLERLMVAAGLDWNQLDMLALGVGPGSFTGLRVSAATIDGLNAVLQKPILAISSLAVSACQADESGPVWVLEDARAGEMFAACYDDGQVVESDACHTYGELTHWPVARYVAHSPPPGCEGWTRLALRRERGEALASEIRTRLDSTGNFDQLPRMVVPSYMQRSQAERNAAHG